MALSACSSPETAILGVERLAIALRRFGRITGDAEVIRH
jgi:hypothetical protein